jgi:hypothetical protein
MRASILFVALLLSAVHAEAARTCSCVAPPGGGNCSASVSCPSGCYAVCGSSCSAGCVGGLGAVGLWEAAPGDEQIAEGGLKDLDAPLPFFEQQ